MTRRAHIRGIQDVAERNLCTGCGTCAFIQPDRIRMVDDLLQGRRPIVALVDGVPADTSEALGACPGVALAHEETALEGGFAELRGGWGPVLAVFEGYASDETLRFSGSSGGIATALAQHSMTSEGMAGTLHIASRADVPYLNETVYTTEPVQLLEATGSRYAPASPCDRLDLIEDNEAPSVFIGKPCDVAGAVKARRTRPQLDRRLGLTIAIFCAGTPTLAGTLEMLERMGITDPADLTSLRYRGNGWPGKAVAESRDRPPSELTYEQSWGEILQRHRQWRCYVCADHTGEFADVAVGDPWYRSTTDDPGQSLVVARTDRGLAIIRSAIATGSVQLQQVPSQRLPESQPNLLKTRGAVWGRSWILRLVGLPAPRFERMPTFRYWLALSTKEKLQSTVGTLRRVRRKKLTQRAVVRPLDSTPPRRSDYPGGSR